jgi:hypothetical protein
MKYCPQRKKAQARLFLCKLALRTAHHKARNGFKSDAQSLVENFPEMSTFRFEYFKCCIEIRLSRWLPYWVVFKKTIGPPIRIFLKKAGYRLGLLKEPPKIS